MKFIGISRKEVASTIATTAVVAAAIAPMETRYVLLQILTPKSETNYYNLDKKLVDVRIFWLDSKALYEEWQQKSVF